MSSTFYFVTMSVSLGVAVVWATWVHLREKQRRRISGPLAFEPARPWGLVVGKPIRWGRHRR